MLSFPILQWVHTWANGTCHTSVLIIIIRALERRWKCISRNVGRSFYEPHSRGQLSVDIPSLVTLVWTFLHQKLGSMKGESKKIHQNE
jgi:hypothetical protein